MSRTITSLFDSRSDAEAAKARLTASRIDADNIRIIDQSTSSASSGRDDDDGFWASIKNFFLPDEDAYAYREGVRRGGYMLCASVDEDEADEAIRILDESSSVDFDSRQEDWRKEGWTGYGASSGMRATDTDRRTGNSIDEETIPVVEEELRVGKREVTRGGARVRSYVRETPVHEQVTLRDEHVSVERRPVDRKLSDADLQADEFRDRTIEMTETDEEAVIGKEARVREEVVVRKTVDERVQDIDETVRKTEVEIDEDRDGDRSAFGSLGRRDESSDSDLPRSDYQRTDRDRT